MADRRRWPGRTPAPNSDTPITISRFSGRLTAARRKAPISFALPNRLRGWKLQYAAIAFELEPLAGIDPSDASHCRSPSNFALPRLIVDALRSTSRRQRRPQTCASISMRPSSRNSAAPASRIRRRTSRCSGRSLMLTARSLSTIRDLGLLDRDFLAVLPNRQDRDPRPVHTNKGGHR